MKNPNPFVAAPNDPTLDAFGRRYPIELKNIDFNPHFTRETHCFRATVYLNGKRVMKVENDGNGGAHNYYPVHGQSKESFRAMLDDSCKEAYESLDDDIRERYKSILINGDHALTFSLEYVITELLNEHLCLKEMRKKLKSKITVFDEDDGKVYFFKMKPLAPNIKYLKSVLAERNEGKSYVWLNELPEHEAMVYWRRLES
jgi:hypothetical protein